MKVSKARQWSFSRKKSQKAQKEKPWGREANRIFVTFAPFCGQAGSRIRQMATRGTKIGALFEIVVLFVATRCSAYEWMVEIKAVEF